MRLESLPAEKRADPAAFRVRLRCGAPLAARELGEGLAALLRGGAPEPPACKVARLGRQAKRSYFVAQGIQASMSIADA